MWDGLRGHRDVPGAGDAVWDGSWGGDGRGATVGSAGMSGTGGDGTGGMGAGAGAAGGGGAGPVVPVQLALGAENSCALMSNGTVKCWGSASHVGNGDTSTMAIVVPEQVAGLTGVTQVDSHGNRTCALKSDGSVLCWGQAGVDQGDNNDDCDGDRTYVPTPTPITSGASQLSVGHAHVCVNTTQGAVLCWGDGQSGQLGNGSDLCSEAPVTVQVTGTQTVHAGYATSCAVLAGGDLRCWGLNTSGQLGQGSTTPSSSNAPLTVPALASTTKLSSYWFHQCALAGGAVHCWGSNSAGQCGVGAAENPVLSPEQGLSNVIDVATGRDFSCVILNDGTLRCWGTNSVGQLGNGQTGAGGPTPVQVQGISDAIQVECGQRHCCTLQQSSEVRCWGANSDGQLGNGNTANASMPATVMGL